MILNIIILILVIIIFLIIIKNKFFDGFSNASGYGFRLLLNQNKSIFTSLVPISKSTDIKLLSFINQLKYSIIKPPNTLKYTGTEQGLISRTPKKYNNIILVPGLSDCILKQNNNIVWTENYKNIKKNIYTSKSTNKDGHFHSIRNILKSMNYFEGDKMNTLNYNFIDLNLEEIVDEFKNLLKENTVIIAYDFGCVIINLCIQYLTEKEKKLINKLLFICPTIGGVPLSLKEYFSGNGILSSEQVSKIDSCLLSFPNEKFHTNPVIIYNNISYKPDSIPTLIKNNLYKNFNMNDLLKLQENSFINPEIDTTIIGCSGYNTPTCYNYKNNLKELPERYLPKHSNKNSSMIPFKTIEGLQTDGDSVVSLKSIKHLHSLWNKNCNLEIINSHDHYTILKSYELGLMISKLV